MFIIICIAITLSVVSTTDVTVFKKTFYYRAEPGLEPEPVGVSQFPLKLSYDSDDWFWIRIKFINKSPRVTAITVTYQTDERTYEADNYTESVGPRKGEKYYLVEVSSGSNELKVKLNLYTSNKLCSSLLVADGRAISNITNGKKNKEFKYYATCVQSVCLLLVDLKNKCDDAETTNNTTVIVSSAFGIALILLVIIAIWKRCRIKRNPSGTPRLPINEPSAPFYLNMLFRRECEQEIAEIEQHHYEEIREHQNEDIENNSEEINPQELMTERVQY